MAAISVLLAGGSHDRTTSITAAVSASVACRAFWHRFGDSERADTPHASSVRPMARFPRRHMSQRDKHQEKTSGLDLLHRQHFGDVVP